MDLALNNLQWLVCKKKKKHKQPTNFLLTMTGGHNEVRTIKQINIKEIFLFALSLKFSAH